MERSGITDVPAGLGTMTETILEALPGDRIVQSNALATVTSNCLIVKNLEGRSQTIIPIVHLSSITTAKTTHPVLLVISAACMLISAAAHCSKEGDGAVVPTAILGLLFLLAYLAYRKVSVCFTTHSEKTATNEGTPGEAAKLIKAVRSVQAAKADRAEYGT